LLALKSDLEPTVGAAATQALLDHADARGGLDASNARLEEEFVGNRDLTLKPADGEVGRILAQASARRWQQELRAVAEAASVEAQYEAYAGAPEIYQARRYLEVLTNGLRNARKFFLAIEPGERKFHVRVEAQDTGESSLTDTTTRMQP
jgi:regulator of protease activity HflC (stomatin/prohibitin superfamily)